MKRMIAVPRCAARAWALLCTGLGVNRRQALLVVILATVVSVGTAEEPPPSAPYMLTFSPDGQRLAVATGKPDSKVALTVWDTATLHRLWEVRDRQGIAAVAFAPDGQTLAIGRLSEEAKVYDSVAGKLRATYGGHGTVARAVGFAPDGKLLAVGSYEGFIKLWDWARGTEVRTLTGPKGRIYEVVFSPDGTRLLSVGGNTARLWNVGAGQEQHLLPHASLVRSGLFAPDGRTVVTGGGDATVRSWDVKTGTPRWKLERYGNVNTLAYSPSRDVLAISGSGRRIELVSPVFRECDESQRRRLDVLLAHLDDDSYAVRDAASREILKMGLMAEPSLRRLTTESKSAEVRLRCRHLRQQVLTTPQTELSGHGDEVESVAFAPDGNLLASVDRTGTVRLWEIATRRIRGHFVPSETTGHFDDNSPRGTLQ